MTPATPGDPQKGKPDEDKVAEEAKESKAAEAETTSEEQPEPKPKRTRKKRKGSDRYIVRGRRRGKKKSR